MDLALGVAVGSSMQIALLVTPLMVIIGWGINVEMSLLFNVYETAVMFIAVVMVNYLIMVNDSTFFIVQKKPENDVNSAVVSVGWQEQLVGRFHVIHHVSVTCY